MGLLKNAIGIYDGLENVISGLGTSKDKRSSTEFTDTSLDDSTLETMYGNDWLSGKIVDCPAEDMTRKWRTIKSAEITPEQIEAIKTLENNLDAKGVIQEALKNSRLYGGSVVFMNMADRLGSDDTPLEYEKIGAEDLIGLIQLDKTQLEVKDITEEIESPNYRKPEFYTIKGTPTKIHHTRVLRFDGYYSPWNIRKTNQYWHISVLKRTLEAIKNSQSTANSINSIVYEASVNVVKIPDLFAKLTRTGGESTIIDRFKLADLMKSINNMMILDSKEDYAKVSTSFAGLPDLMIKSLNVAAGASDIPATRLLGQSAQGLNATGEGDLKNYYDMIQSKQEEDLRPELTKLDMVLVPSAIGSMPLDWGFEFNSLWQLSELQIAEKTLKNAQRDKAYIETGTLPQSIIAKQLKEDGTYSGIDNEYIQALEGTEGLESEATGE